MKIITNILIAATTIISLTACGEQPSDAPVQLFSDVASACKEIEIDLDTEKCVFDQDHCEAEIAKIKDLSKENTYAVSSNDEDTKLCKVQIQRATFIGLGTHYNDSDEKISLQFEEKLETSVSE